MLLKKSGKKWIQLLAAVLLPAILLGTVKALFTPDGRESAEDAFWHVAAARRTIPEMTAKQFPLTLSVWRDHYADKELGFHLLLKAYIQVGKLFHSELTPPFPGAMFFFLLLFFAGFTTAAHSLGIAPPRILYAAMLCAVFLPNFTYRALMLRPHIFSMALMMFAFAILANGPQKRKTCLGIFILSFFYSWSYSSPHLICVTAFLFGMGWFPREKWNAFFAFFASAAGVFCGLLLHPQTPNTLLIWKVQAIDALLAPISGNMSRFPFAAELQPPRFAWILLALPAIVAVYFCLMTLIRAIEKEGVRQLPPNLSALALSALFWTAAMCLISIRPVEYAIPSLCLAGMLLLTHAETHGLFTVLEKRMRTRIVLGLLLLVCGSFTLNNVRLNLEKWSRPAPVKLAEQLRKILPPGKRVANIVWSDFPYLFFAAPEYEYTWALDPMFGYVYDRTKIARIAGIGMNTMRHVPSSELRDASGADYAVVLFKENALGTYLERTCGWKVIYKGPDGWLFRLKN